MRAFLVGSVLFLAACNCGSTAPAQVGEECSPTRGCDENLTCRMGVCVEIGGTAGGSAGGASAGGGGDAGGTATAGGSAGGSSGGSAGGTAGGGAAGGTAGGAAGGTAGGAAGGNACGACITPPASACDNASTLRVYSLPGTCGGTTCSYPSSTVSCAGGCANGACTQTGWAQQTTGTTQGLWAVWGSAANAVWAAGSQGTMLFWNGAGWQARAVPTSLNFWSMSGFSASSVFAVAHGTFSGVTVLHFDGTTWSDLYTPLNLVGVPPWSETPSCIASTGDREALWSTIEGRTNPTRPVRVLYRLKQTAGTWSRQFLAETAPITPGMAQNLCQIQVLPNGQAAIAASNSLVWTGTALIELGAPPQSNRGLYLQSATDGIAIAGVLRTLTANAWSMVNVGFPTAAVHGTSATRAFVVGGLYQGGTYYPRISLWDGLGATPLTLPAMATGSLNAVWAAPTGEVFAVGDDGLALKGP